MARSAGRAVPARSPRAVPRLGHVERRIGRFLHSTWRGNGSARWATVAGNSGFARWWPAQGLPMTAGGGGGFA
uniref:Uncharacterized protein n=1 Tax=Oryza sativa subsp. japonica TaxID=39947 RepID=Q652H5_ORYSJ|nr:hypothetical protein [Oryza sativa Japonica Group]